MDKAQTNPSTEAERRRYPESHPCHHTLKLKEMLAEIVDHAREDVAKVNEPKAQALFETTAEMLQGLIKAYEDYEGKTEQAWH